MDKIGSENMNYRKLMEEILKDKGEEIDKLLSEKMKEGPPKNISEKPNKQKEIVAPEDMEEAILCAPIIMVVGMDPKTKRPIYYEGALSDAIHA